LKSPDLLTLFCTEGAASTAVPALVAASTSYRGAASVDRTRPVLMDILPAGTALTKYMASIAVPISPQFAKIGVT
jgi:hypothetical protein